MDFSKKKEVRGESEEDKMVFYYNREERLKNAPQEVQNLYDGTFKVFKPGLFKALVSTKTNRLVFMALIICFLLVVFLGFFNRQNENILGGVPLELTAFSFEETVYVSVKFEEPPKKYKIENPLNFDVIIEFLDAQKNVVEKRAELNIYNGNENFLRTTFHDYDIFYINAEVILDGKSVNLKCPVEKR